MGDLVFRHGVQQHGHTTGSAQVLKGTGFHLAIFVIGFLIVLTRRPDALFNAQFLAEDGRVWFPDAYDYGLRSLLLPAFGYLHTLTRLIALLAQLFPFSAAPLIMNLGAIAIQILPVNLFLSSRFSGIGLPIRLLAGFLYLAFPNTQEIDANITTLQWHLGLLAFLVLIALPPRTWGWRIFDGVVLALISLNGPMGIVLVPFAGVLWWKRQQRWQVATLALLIPGAMIQGLTMLLHLGERRQAELGVSLERFFIILGRQVFSSSLLGMNSQKWIIQSESAFLFAVVATVVGLAVLWFALRYAPTELKIFIVFTSIVFAMSLARPLVGPAPQWQWLCFPGGGNRYYFLPMLAFVAALLWMAIREAPSRALRHFAAGLLLLLPIGIYQDWNFPRLRDYHFQAYADRFERAPLGTKMTIPIKPNWSLEITKHERVLWGNKAQPHRDVPVGAWK